MSPFFYFSRLPLYVSLHFYYIFFVYFNSSSSVPSSSILQSVVLPTLFYVSHINGSTTPRGSGFTCPTSRLIDVQNVSYLIRWGLLSLLFRKLYFSKIILGHSQFLSLMKLLHILGLISNSTYYFCNFLFTECSDFSSVVTYLPMLSM